MNVFEKNATQSGELTLENGKHDVGCIMLWDGTSISWERDYGKRNTDRNPVGIYQTDSEEVNCRYACPLVAAWGTI